MTSYLPGAEFIIGSFFSKVVSDPILSGLILLAVVFILWAFTGSGLEVGIVIFLPLIMILASTSLPLLPSWIIILAAAGLGLGLMFFFRSFGQR